MLKCLSLKKLFIDTIDNMSSGNMKKKNLAAFVYLSSCHFPQFVTMVSPSFLPMFQVNRAALASLRLFPTGLVHSRLATVSVSSNVKYCSCRNDQRKCILVHMFMETAGMYSASSLESKNF